MTNKYLHWILFLLALILLLAIAVVVSLVSGEIDIPFRELPAVLTEKSGIQYSVLSNIRIPRTLLAFSVGGALSLTGAILQGVYRNPLVEPYTLGISGGAALGVALAIVLGLHHTLGAIVLPLSGFAGSIATIFLVWFLSMNRGAVNINRMLLIGVMISFVASSAMMFLMSITTRENLHGIVFWMMGSVEEPNNALIQIALWTSLAGLIFSFFFARPLNALRLGQEKAQHLGINSRRTIRILFIIASVLTGMSVSIAGVIGFVGLIIPHIVKLITGPDYRVVLLGSFLGGSFFLIVSDILARTLIAPNELPIGVITGIAGGLVFIVVLARVGSKSKIH